MNSRPCCLVFVVLIVAGVTISFAATPQAVKVQGYLSDRSGGTPVPAEGVHTIVFDLFDAVAGGSLIASSGSVPVQVSNGVYEAELPFGEVDFDAADRFLEITVNGELLTPRLRVVSTPYAYRTERAAASDRADMASGVEPGSIVAESLAPGSVTADALGIPCSEGEILVRAGAGWACSTIGGVPSCAAGDFLLCYGGPPETIDIGTCHSGKRFCLGGGGGFGPCSGDVTPQPESCDDLDNDCNGAVDDSAVDASSWYDDADGDGYGDPLNETVACDAPAGTVADDTDCDDGRAHVYPGAFELCDGLDNDCDDVNDESCSYCTPAEAECQHACAISCWVSYSGDPTGQLDCIIGCDFCGATTECIDTYINLWTAPGIDACLPDGDQAQLELCIQLAAPGEWIAFWGAECVDSETRPCGTDVGECETGTQTCATGVWGACVGGIDPAFDDCDGLDNDCNGVPDDFPGPLCPLQQGVCAGWSQDCGGAAGWLPCDNSSIGPDYQVTEVTCDGLDNDCDGVTDEGFEYYFDGDGDGYGDSEISDTYCSTPGPGWVADGGDCADDDEFVYPGAVEVCDAVDNDCNGTEDDGNLCDDGKPCTEDVCSAGECANDPQPGSCLISDVCYADTDLDPANDCQECDSAVSATGWTYIEAATPCLGGTCDGAGNCVP